MALQKIGWEVYDLGEEALRDEGGEGPWSDTETKAAIKKATKKKAKARRRTKPKPKDEEAIELLEKAAKAATDPPPWDDPDSPAKDLAELAARDPRMECPVCRSIDLCACDEGERAFVRRTRWEKDVETLARCRRCSRPMSVVYIRRPGSGEPGDRGYRLNCFDSIYACPGCSPEALASVVLGQAERGHLRS